MSRWLKKVLFVLRAPLAILGYMLMLGQYGPRDFFGVILEPATAAYLGLVAIWVVAEASVLVPLVGEPPIFGEFSGLHYDSRRWLIRGLLTLPDVASCMDHAQGRWLLLPNEGLRWFGLALLAVALGIAINADRHLVRHFRVPGVLAARSVLAEGPYRYIRHPRTAGILLAKLATPLALGSGLGLFALIPAVLFFPLYIQLEEGHLLRVFGDTYRFYRARTKRIIPFVY